MNASKVRALHKALRDTDHGVTFTDEASPLEKIAKKVNVSRESIGLKAYDLGPAEAEEKFEQEKVNARDGEEFAEFSENAMAIMRGQTLKQKQDAPQEDFDFAEDELEGLSPHDYASQKSHLTGRSYEDCLKERLYK